ncbi:hypothetical protein TKK_0002931 [Trichogramma kaykai]
MKYASRISNKRVCVYMDSIESAEVLINSVKEIEVNGITVGICPLKSPNKRVVISNVSPVISDQVLIDSLAKMGIKPAEDEAKLLPAIALRRADQTNHVYFSTSSNTRCFNCNEEGHQARHCRQGRPEPTEKEKENALAQEKATPAEIETSQSQPITSSVDVGKTPTKPFEIFSQPFNKKRIASPTTSHLSENGNAQEASPHNIKPAKKPRLKKSRKDESKPSLEDITSQITQAVVAQGATDIDIRAPTLTKFLHDSGEDVNAEDSVYEEFSSTEESSFTTDTDHTKTHKAISRGPQ